MNWQPCKGLRRVAMFRMDRFRSPAVRPINTEMRHQDGHGEEPILTALPRIVLFNNNLTPYTNRLYNRLAERGVDLATVSCCEQESNRNWARSFDSEFPTTVLRGFALRLAPNRFAHVNVGVWRAFDRLRPDLLVINGFYPSMLSAALWAVTRKVPLALTIDGWANDMPRSPYHSVVRPAVLGRCRGVIVPGRKGREFFIAAGVSEARIFTVPIVTAWDGPTQLRPFEERPNHLVWAAQLNNEVKNVAFFTALTAKLKRTIPDLRVTLAGDGPAKQDVFAALRDAGIPFTHDVVPWNRMAELFGSGRLLVLPSLAEPWGLVCNEAMQCGTPCAVSPFVGAADDLVLSRENGLVLPLDVDLWAQEIAPLVTNQLQWSHYSAAAAAAMRARTVDASAEAFVAAATAFLGRPILPPGR